MDDRSKKKIELLVKAICTSQKEMWRCLGNDTHHVVCQQALHTVDQLLKLRESIGHACENTQILRLELLTLMSLDEVKSVDVINVCNSVDRFVKEAVVDTNTTLKGSEMYDTK